MLRPEHVERDHSQRPCLARAPLSKRLAVAMSAPSAGKGDYPTSTIQKGPTLVYESMDLSGEGIGLGVPVLKFKRRVVFPGGVTFEERWNDDCCTWIVDYELNLEERVILRNGKSIKSGSFYELTERLAALHRAKPFSRNLIERLNTALRRMYGIDTAFETTTPVATIRVSYVIDSHTGVLHVRADVSNIVESGCTEIILLNEQDASHFNCYRDSSGIALAGEDIGTWDEVDAEHVTFIDSRHNLTLGLRRVERSAMFRGREFIPGRLSWAGIAYVINPPLVHFNYDIAIERGT